MTDIQLLDKTIREESPLLFLGAGFSMGAKLNSGEKFPSGTALKDQILHDYLKLSETDDDYTELRGYSLSDLCQYVKNDEGVDRLNDWLADLFRNAKPAEFHYSLAKFPWRKIYTTNIDDIIEVVYGQLNTEILVQNMQRKSTLKKSCTEYLKLHGCVNNPSEGFVFSKDEYIGTMMSPMDYRFMSLSHDMNAEHFIFVGTEFDELNIDYFLSIYEQTGYKSTKGRLFFINPKPSLKLSSKIKKLKGHIINWTTEEFCSHLAKDSVKTTPKEQLKISVQKTGFNPIRELMKAHNPSDHKDSSLYFGYMPTWGDIFSEWDFVNTELIAEFEKFLAQTENGSNVGIFAICGKAFSGKTVLLRRLAANLLQDNYEVFSFSGRDFEYYQFYRTLLDSEHTHIALIMDDASYHYRAIRQLSRLSFRGKHFVVLTTSRPFYHQRKRYHFVEENYKEYYIENVSEQYAKSILDKLKEKGYLGDLKAIKESEDQVQKIVSLEDIFTTLSYITHGEGFSKRLLAEIDPLLKKEPLANDLLLKIAIFEELDLPFFPKELITSIYKDKTSYVLVSIDDFVKFNSHGDPQLRAKFYAKNIIKANKKATLIKAISDILIYISPNIAETKQGGRNSYWCEIQEALTKQRLLRSVLKIGSTEMRNMLLDIQNYYSDDSHYWLQLGISEQRESDYEKALNHFKQAEALNPNSNLIPHVIGRNYMKHANSKDSLKVAQPLHDEGERRLLHLIRNHKEYNIRAFSVHSYLYEELNYIERFKINVSNNRLKQLFDMLSKIVEKDPEDIMAKHMSNYFHGFLRRSGKLGIIKLQFKDLSKLNELFSDYRISIEELLDFQD